MTVTRRIAGYWLRGCRCRAANQRGNYECCLTIHSARSYHFVVAVWRTKRAESQRVKYWEIIADNLHKAGWSLGWVSQLSSISPSTEHRAVNVNAVFVHCGREHKQI